MPGPRLLRGAAGALDGARERLRTYRFIRCRSVPRGEARPSYKSMAHSVQACDCRAGARWRRGCTRSQSDLRLDDRHQAVLLHHQPVCLQSAESTSYIYNTETSGGLSETYILLALSFCTALSEARVVLPLVPSEQTTTARAIGVCCTSLGRQNVSNGRK